MYWQGNTRTSTAHLCARCALKARTRRRRRRSRMQRAPTVPGTRILLKAATTSLAVYAIKGTQGRTGRSAARVLRAHTKLSMARLHACYVSTAHTRQRQARSRRQRAPPAHTIHILGRAAGTSEIVHVILGIQGRMGRIAQRVSLAHTRTSMAQHHAACAQRASTLKRLERRRI